MDIENKNFKRYVTVYMLEGAALLIAILVLVLFVSPRGDRMMAQFVAQNLNAVKISMYVIAVLCLGVILLFRQLTMKAVETKGNSEAKALFLANRGIVINSIAYLPAILAIVLYLLGMNFKDVRNYFFATIILSYVAFYRYNRFAELAGIARLNLNK